MRHACANITCLQLRTGLLREGMPNPTVRCTARNYTHKKKKNVLRDHILTRSRLWNCRCSRTRGGARRAHEKTRPSPYPPERKMSNVPHETAIKEVSRDGMALCQKFAKSLDLPTLRWGRLTARVGPLAWHQARLGATGSLGAMTTLSTWVPVQAVFDLVDMDGEGE